MCVTVAADICFIYDNLLVDYISNNWQLQKGNSN